MRLFSAVLIASALLSAAASAQTLDRIKETKQLNIGFRTDAAPLSFLDTSNNPAGYTPLICDRIAQAIADKLQLENMNASFIPVETKTRFEKVASGEIDMLCGAATITLSRREIVDFSVPIYVDGTSVMLPQAAGNSLADLKGKKVGFRSATTTAEAVVNSFESAGLEAEMIRFDNHPAGFEALKNGELDAYFADQSILLVNFISGNMQDRFKVMDKILTIEKQGIALPRGDSDFRLLVDTVISELYASGAIRQLFSQAMPGVEPGAAMNAMYVMSPTLP